MVRFVPEPFLPPEHPFVKDEILEHIERPPVSSLRQEVWLVKKYGHPAWLPEEPS